MILFTFFLSILYLFLLLLFLGFSFFFVFKIHLSEIWMSRVILYLGSGLGVLVFLIILFGLFRIPLDYRLFFVLSLLCPLYYLNKNKFTLFQGFSLFPSFSVSRKEYILYGTVLLAVIVLFATFLTGAFSYPYLEDDDPWEHAVAVKYVAETKTYHVDTPEIISHYLEPYPPSFDAILALLYQINGSVFFTLKFFNTLLIALGILFFFVLAKDLFGIEVAAISSIILVALPSWMSHFIWSHTVGLVLFFPALTISIRAFHDKKYMMPAILLIAAQMVTHPFVSVLFGVFFISVLVWNFLFIFFSATDKKRVFISWNPFTQGFMVGLCGVLLSFIYWGDQFIRHGTTGVLYSHTGGFGGVASSGLETAADLYINPAYTLHDFLVAPLVTKIDQPTGFGVLVFILSIFGLLFIVFNAKKYFARTQYHLAVAFLFLITFIGLLGGHLPYSILTHRFWAYVSIPLALLVGVFIFALYENVKKNRVLVVGLFILLFIGIFGIPFFNTFNSYTSWYPKYVVETSQWPPGVAWSSVQELEGYLWLHDNVVSKRVFSICKEEKFLIGFDIETHFPSTEMKEWRKNLAGLSLPEMTMLFSEYDAVSLEYSCVKNVFLNEEELNVLANELAQSYPILFMNDEIIVYTIPRSL